MMPIDSSIYNMVGKYQPIEVPDPLERQTRLAQLKKLANQGQVDDMQLAESKAKQAMQEKVKFLLAKNNGDLGLAQREAAETGDYYVASEFQNLIKSQTQTDALTQKSIYEAQEAHSKMTKEQRIQTKAGLEDLASAFDWVEKGGPPEQTEQRYARVLQAFPPEVRDKYNMGPTYDPMSGGIVKARATAWDKVTEGSKPGTPHQNESRELFTLGKGNVPEYIIDPTTERRMKAPAPPISFIERQAASNYDGSTPLKPGLEPISKAIAAGDQEMLTTARAMPQFQDINARASYLRAEAGGGDLEGKIRVQAKATSLKDFEGSGKANLTIRALNTMTEHVGTARRLAASLDAGDVPAFNRIAQELSKATGKPAVTNLETLREFLAGEVATVAAGGHLTEGAIKSAADKIRLAQSPAQMIGALDVMDEIAGGKLVAINQDYARYSKGGKSLVDDNRLTPATIAAFNKVEQRQRAKTQTNPELLTPQKLPESIKGGLPPKIMSDYNAGKVIEGPDGTRYQKGK